MRVDAPHDDDLDAILDRLDAQALHARIDTALDALPGAQRRAIDARVVRELAYDDLAGELDCSAQNARAHVSRGLRTLNSILKGAHR